MNHIYRVIFNRQTGTFQAVAETAKTPHKTSKSKTAKAFKALLTPISLALSLAFGLTTHAAPKEGQVTAGVATIHQNGLITDINQSSQNAAINWQSFNVGKNETVNFNQPNAQSVTLNRVIGNERSVIDGAMNANGKVFISNANGMLIGKDAQINVGSLVATTANISDDDLMNGRYQFTGGQGSIENLGQISVPKGGMVALVAPIVKNGGKITAHEGNALLASAENFSITLPDNANFKYTLNKGTLQGLVDNGGAILADGGRVVLTAQGVDTVKKSLIKHTGAIQANTVSNKNGVIELLGDLDNSALTVSGSLKAEAKESGDGGFIETSASQVKIEDSAEISATAKNGKVGTLTISQNNLIVGENGSISGNQTKEFLKTGNLILPSNGNKVSRDDKINLHINDEIDWNENNLTLKAQDDIYIDKNLTGKNKAKLNIKYGQSQSGEHFNDEYKTNYHLGKDVKVTLPTGNSLSVQFGKDDKRNKEFAVIDKMPEINADGSTNPFASKYIALNKDIDISYTANNSNFAGWDSSVKFKDKFDEEGGDKFHGLGYSLNGLTVNPPDQDNVGLFRNTTKFDIRDLTLTNSKVTGKDNVGTLVGNVKYGVHIKNVNANVNVNGQNCVGGLVGCSVQNNNITGYMGFTWGDVFNNETYNTKVSGNVAGKDYVGGLIGSSGGGWDYIKNTEVQADIKGNDYVGGLYGSDSNFDLKVEKTYFDGDITGNDNVGGFLGSGSYGGRDDGYGDITDSYVQGKIQGNESVGGLIGTAYDVYFKNVYANTEVAGNKAVGNFIGTGWLTNSNLVAQTSHIGIENSYFKKQSQGTNDLIGERTGNDKDRVITEAMPKTETELKDRSTFKDWDFDNIWYMNEGSMPKLRAFATPLAINPTAQTTAGVKAPDLSKTYDGKAVNTVDDLKKLNGWKDNFDTEGLATGDSVDGIFQAGTLTIDESKGDWKGAKDVKEGGYELYPTGTLKDEYQQKYIIEWNKGTLTIKPAKLTITAMNNIKPEGENNPDVSRIGVVVTGLVEGESISDVDLSYSDDKKWQGDISIIRVGEPVFKNGKASNYEITKNHGKLLTVQKGYDLKHLENKSEKEVDEIRNLLNSVENEMLLAHAVYGSETAKKGDDDRFYEVWEVKDNQTGIITKELHKLGFENEPKDGTKTYTKKYELLGRGLDSSDGEVRKGDDVYRDGFFSAEYPNGLAMGVYKDTHQDKYFIVFRGTDTGKALSPHDSDGGTNLTQGAGKLPLQYQRAREVVQELIEKYPNRDYTIIGHSLGGGLASFSSIQQNKQIPTVVFNQAQLHENNIPGAIEYMKPYKFTLQYGHELSRYTRETFGQVNSYIFDYDILQFGDAANNAYIGNVHKTEWLPHIGNVGESLFGDTRTNDHLMPHVIKTQRLANIVAQNNEITANCQKGCVKIQEHQWTPPAQLKEIDIDRSTKYQKDRDNIQRDIAERERKGKDTEKQRNNLNKVTQKLEQAEVTSGKITVVRGNDSWEVGKNGFLDFKFGDVISTENKKATIYFPDGSWIELDKNSSIRIEIDTTSKRPMADQISLIKGKILRKGNKKPE